MRYSSGYLCHSAQSIRGGSGRPARGNVDYPASRCSVIQRQSPHCGAGESGERLARSGTAEPCSRHVTRAILGCARQCFGISRIRLDDCT
jgi:hypothetical protein